MTLEVSIPTNPPVLVQVDSQISAPASIQVAAAGPRGPQNLFIGPTEPTLPVGFGAAIWIETTADYSDIIELHLGYA